MITEENHMKIFKDYLDKIDEIFTTVLKENDMLKQISTEQIQKINNLEHFNSIYLNKATRVIGAVQKCVHENHKLIIENEMLKKQLND